MSDIFLNTIKQPIIPHITPTIEQAMIALIANGSDNVLKSSCIMQNYEIFGAIKPKS